MIVAITSSAKEMQIIGYVHWSGPMLSTHKHNKMLNDIPRGLFSTGCVNLD